jgi:hypothetical protein
MHSLNANFFTREFFIKNNMTGPPLWSNGQGSWGFQIFWEEVGLERGSLSLMSTIEELVQRKSSGSGQETEITAIGIRCADNLTLYP